MIPLYVDLEREWRGGQSQAWLTLRGLQDLGHKAELVAARNSPLAQRTAAEGIVVHMVPRLGLRLWAALAIRRLVEGGRFALIHVNEPHALTAAWLAGAHRRLPLLFSRRIGFPLRRGPVSRARYGAVTEFIANCREVAQSLIESGIPTDRIVVVNEGVEVPPLPTLEMRHRARERWGVRENEFLFGCVGFLLPEKGQRYIVQGLAQIRREFPDARLLLAGDGPCREELEQLARDTGQTGAVHFAGFVEDVAQVYAALDAFLFPSLFEGLGTSLQAAMAWGLPVVSTARGGLAEVVDHGRTGLVVVPDETAFASGMLRLLRDNELRRQLGQAAREEVQRRFSASQMAANTLRVYEKIRTHGGTR